MAMRQMSVVETLTSRQRLALLLRRLAALAYDLLLLLALSLVAVIPWVVLAGEASQPGDPGLQLWLGLVCVSYVSAAWVRQGATLGMLAWGLRLQTSTAQGLTYSQALLRLLLAVLGTGALGITWWWCLFDPQGRALHDRLAATQVFFQSRSRR